MDRDDTRDVIKWMVKIAARILDVLLVIFVVILATIALSLQLTRPEKLACYDQIVSISALIVFQTALLRSLLKRYRFAWALSAAMAIMMMVLTVSFLTGSVESNTMDNYTLNAGFCGGNGQSRCCEKASNVSRMFEVKCNPGSLWIIPQQEGENTSNTEANKTAMGMWTTPPKSRGENITNTGANKTDIGVWITPPDGLLGEGTNEILGKLPPCSTSQSRCQYIEVHHPSFLALISFCVAIEGFTIIHLFLWCVQNFKYDDVNLPSFHQRGVDLCVFIGVIFCACVLIIVAFFFLTHASGDELNGVADKTHARATDLRNMVQSLRALKCCPDTDNPNTDNPVSDKRKCKILPHVAAAFESGKRLTLCCQYWYLTVQFTPGGMLDTRDTPCDRNVDACAFFGPGWYQLIATIFTILALEALCIVSPFFWFRQTSGAESDHEFSVATPIRRTSLITAVNGMHFYC